MTEKLQLDEPADGVARLTIANPERRGALDHEILDALAEHARTLDARCLVIRGTGDVFSAGYDIGNLSEQEFEESAEKLVAHPFHDALEALEAYRYPVVAEINGHAIGGGLELALTCDIRLAASGVKMGMPPAKLGLIYSHTGLAKFIDVCGPANTAELFFVGRNVDSERAREMGLVNQVVDPDALDARVLDLASEIASNAPLSLAGNKQLLRELRALRLPAGARARAGGAARILLRLRGLPRGSAGVRGEAQAAVARPLAVGLLFQPLRHEARAHMDVHLARASPECLESVRLAGGDDHHLAGADLDLFVWAAERRLTVEHDEDLGVLVRVQRGTAAGRGVHEEEGTHDVVVRALELE